MHSADNSSGGTLMTAQRNEKNKKRFVRAGIAFAATAGVLIGGLFHSPADVVSDPMNALDRMAPPPAVELVVPDAEEDPFPDLDGDGGSGDPVNEEKKRSLRDKFRKAFLRLPKGVRASVGIPLWAIGWVIITAVTALWSAVFSPVLSSIGGWLLTGAFILLCTLCAVKAAHPELPIKKILNRKTISGVFIAILLCAGADAALPFLWTGYEKISTILRCSAATAILCVTVLPKVIRRERKKKASA